MGTRSAISTINLEVKSTIKNLVDSGVSASAQIGRQVLNATMQTGVSANEANRAWERYGATITSGGTNTIDIYDFANIDIGAGTALDALGQTLAIEEVVGLMIFNRSTSAGHLEFEPDATNGWTPIGTHTVATGGALPPNGCFFIWSGNTDAYDVTDASSHRIKLTANGGNVTYDMILIGRHDDDESSSSSSSSSSSQSSSSTSSQSSSSSVSSSSTSSASSASSQTAA